MHLLINKLTSLYKLSLENNYQLLIFKFSLSKVTTFKLESIKHQYN